MATMTGKKQVTIPVAVLDETGLHADDQGAADALKEGEARVCRGALSFERAFGALTSTHPPGYLEQLDPRRRRAVRVVCDTDVFMAPATDRRRPAGRS